MTIEGVEKTGVQVKCKKVTKTKDINLDKKCADDEDDYDSDDDTDKKNEFDTKDIITSFEGRILVFPAHLNHHVEPNESNEDRISVSFNIQLK